MSARPPGAGPLWREEFPIAAAEEKVVGRRQFTKFLVLTSLGMFAGNVWLLVKSRLQRPANYPRVVVARAGAMPIGGVSLFGYPTPDDRCLLVRTAEETYVAYSQKCPHLSCAVVYAAERRRLECPCHDGVFDVRDGRVVQGPPRRPLPRVVLERRGDELVATGLVTGEG
jgi:nitrite reductase/ring-hydroxylating ferredoxin subunit